MQRAFREALWYCNGLSTQIRAERCVNATEESGQVQPPPQSGTAGPAPQGAKPQQQQPSGPVAESYSKPEASRSGTDSGQPSRPNGTSGSGSRAITGPPATTKAPPNAEDLTVSEAKKLLADEEERRKQRRRRKGRIRELEEMRAELAEKVGNWKSDLNANDSVQPLRPPFSVTLIHVEAQHVVLRSLCNQPECTPLPLLQLVARCCSASGFTACIYCRSWCYWSESRKYWRRNRQWGLCGSRCGLYPIC